jgi:hypothetical protein
VQQVPTQLLQRLSLYLIHVCGLSLSVFIKEFCHLPKLSQMAFILN